MLGDATVYATVAVKDIERAKKFYSETLGLHLTGEIPAGVTYQGGGGKLFVYPSENAGTNKATSASWDVDDLESVITELEGKGVIFEQYEMPGATRTGAIHDFGGEKAAWFKDPDGNILAISNS